VRLIALHATSAAINRAATLTEPLRVLVIHPDATPDQKATYQAKGFTVAPT
jgi:hypothetical protein